MWDWNPILGLYLCEREIELRWNWDSHAKERAKGIVTWNGLR
jgi:hypothetical protein